MKCLMRFKIIIHTPEKKGNTLAKRPSSQQIFEGATQVSGPLSCVCWDTGLVYWDT